MNNIKEDRRIKRTRKLLSNALVDLMLEKRYDKITIQDIIDRADVGRSTFYTHFRNKEDLLTSDFEHVLDLLGQHFNQGGEGGLNYLSTTSFFEHVQEQYHLYKALVKGKGAELLFIKGHDYIRKMIEDHLTSHFPPERIFTVPIPLLSNYLAGGLVMLLRWWLENKMPESPEKMNEIFNKLVMPGVISCLNSNN